MGSGTTSIELSNALEVHVLFSHLHQTLTNSNNCQPAAAIAKSPLRARDGRRGILWREVSPLKPDIRLPDSFLTLLLAH